MTIRTPGWLALGAMLLASVGAAGAAGAQQRGTMEFGGFGSAATFNRNLSLNTGVGGGGLVGMYLDPRWSIEFDKSEMTATRPQGLANVNVGILSSRLVNTPLRMGGFSLHVGAGAGVSTETNFLHSYGVNALVGARFALSDAVSLRVDGIVDWLANNHWMSYQSVHVGMSVYRRPDTHVTTRYQTRTERTGSDSADDATAERLRLAEARYQALRDSLAQPDARTASSASALATMEAQIHFATDKSDLTPEAKALLDDKVAVFQANPDMRIVILGNTDEHASDAYNMSLGGRRAAAAKAYLVSKGIAPERIEITSHGERNPQSPSGSTAGDASNRRDGFRLLIGSDYLVSPKP